MKCSATFLEVFDLSFTGRLSKSLDILWLGSRGLSRWGSSWLHFRRDVLDSSSADLNPGLRAIPSGAGSCPPLLVLNPPPPATSQDIATSRKSGGTAEITQLAMDPTA